MKKLIYLTCLTALSLTSCSSGSDSSGNTSESNMLLKKSVETYANDGSTVTTTYSYNGMKLVSSSDSDGYHVNYTYEGDLIKKIQTIDDMSEAVAQDQIFIYNSSNQLTTYIVKDYPDNDGNRETYVHNSDGSISVTTYTGDSSTQDTFLSTGTIHLDNGDVTQVALAVIDQASYTSTQTYTYDTKNSPYKNITGFDKIGFIGGEASGIRHNVLTDLYTSSLSSDVNTTTTYTYNSLNFPLTDSEIEGTDATSIITTQYTYN